MHEIQIPIRYTINFDKFFEKLLNNIEKFIPDNTKDILFKRYNEINKINLFNKVFIEKEKQNNKNKITSNSQSQEKPSIPVPFYGHVVESWCKGVRKNHCLYTQCTNKPTQTTEYCKVCSKQANNNSSNKPNCGNIFKRQQQWTDQLTYQPDGMKNEIPYANIADKMNISIKKAKEECHKLGWSDIPNCHLTIKKARRGRPKTKIAVDSDDEKTPKKRGRPKKIKKGEPTDKDLIEFLLAQMS